MRFSRNPRHSVLPALLQCSSALLHLVTGHYLAEAPRRLCWTNHSVSEQWWAQTYHKLQQCHYHPITDQEIKCRRVLKGIIWAILRFFFFFLMWAEVEGIHAACVVLLPSVADRGATLCCGRRGVGGAGPKTDMLSSAWMPSNRSSSLPLFGSFPPPPAGPSLQSQQRASIAQWLFNTQGIARD